MSGSIQHVVTIVTGGSGSVARELARGLAMRGHAIVVVYLDRQRTAEMTVQEALDSGAPAIAVRADLSDELDVERLFTETISAFSGVDVIVHTLLGCAILYEQASQRLRSGGTIVSVSSSEQMTPTAVQRLRERGVTINGLPPGMEAPGAVRGGPDLLALVDRWQDRPAD